MLAVNLGKQLYGGSLYNSYSFNFLVKFEIIFK